MLRAASDAGRHPWRRRDRGDTPTGCDRRAGRKRRRTLPRRRRRRLRGSRLRTWVAFPVVGVEGLHATIIGDLLGWSCGSAAARASTPPREPRRRAVIVWVVWVVAV